MFLKDDSVFYFYFIFFIEKHALVRYNSHNIIERFFADQLQAQILGSNATLGLGLYGSSIITTHAKHKQFLIVSW